MVLVTDDDAESNADDDARFQLAAQAAGRIVRRSRAHVRLTTKTLSRYTDIAPSSSLYATDRASAAAGNHRIAFNQTVKQVETLSNALVSHLDGLNVLMKHDTFHGLPATVIARSIAEVAASCSWILRPEVSADERAARAYAVLFHSLENSTPQLIPEDADRAVEMREKLIDLLSASGITVKRREKEGNKSEHVAQVSVGSAHVKTGYRISDRVRAEIPAVGRMYAGLSSAAHGESLHVANAWEIPDSFARRIGIVVDESVMVWSKAVHRWFGVEPGLVGNEGDVKTIKQSIHPDVIAGIMARREKGA